MIQLLASSSITRAESRKGLVLQVTTGIIEQYALVAPNSVASTHPVSESPPRLRSVKYAVYTVNVPGAHGLSGNDRKYLAMCLIASVRPLWVEELYLDK